MHADQDIAIERVEPVAALHRSPLSAGLGVSMLRASLRMARGRQGEGVCSHAP
jgi:hypothetical protein